jgi:hypothetical protein
MVQGLCAKSTCLDTIPSIETWVDGSFERTTFAAEGGQIFLGHFGDECPNLCADQTEFTITDVAGMHVIKVFYCGCNNSPPKYAQLLLHGLFPSTDCLPRAAFSTQLLRNFQLANLNSKINAHNYHQSLMQDTNAADPEEASVSL